MDAASYLPSKIISLRIASRRTIGYKLVWLDEFNFQSTLDTIKWRYEEVFKRNREEQWYWYQLRSLDNIPK